MSAVQNCIKCGAKLSNDEKALSRKFLGTGDTPLCLDCLGERYKMTREQLEAWIEKFKREGCTLFGSP